MLLVNHERQIFNDLDIEFVRNVIATIKVTRDNLRDILSDARFMTSLSKIQEHIKSIIYLKSHRNYCQAVCDGSPDNSFEMRISIQKIQTFFKESELLKVNRSTLINPAKVKSVKKISKQKYCVTMTNDEEFPISRPLLKEVKQFLDKL
jgi:DNA-binding LytR/AlgR family response regulator